MVAVIGNPGLERRDGLAVQLGERIAETQAGQDPAEKLLLLLFGAIEIDVSGNGQVVLRDLGDRGIGCRKNGDHPRQGFVGYAGAAESLGNVDAPEPALE